MPPAARSPPISAIPTGSFAPDSPSKIVPLRPVISCCPRTENTTAGSVGETAVATSKATYQTSPKAVHQEAAGRCGQEGAEHPDDNDQYQSGPEPRPADVPAAVEEDQNQCH